MAQTTLSLYEMLAYVALFYNKIRRVPMSDGREEREEREKRRKIEEQENCEDKIDHDLVDEWAQERQDS
jgi:hypothetical protein